MKKRLRYIVKKVCYYEIEADDEKGVENAIKFLSSDEYYEPIESPYGEPKFCIKKRIDDEFDTVVESLGWI